MYVHAMHATGAQAFTGAHFGSGTGPILRTGVQCNPYDMSLAGCHHNSDTEDCSHREDAGVSCPGTYLLYSRSQKNYVRTPL